MTFVLSLGMIQEPYTNTAPSNNRNLKNILLVGTAVVVAVAACVGVYAWQQSRVDQLSKELDAKSQAVDTPVAPVDPVPTTPGTTRATFEEKQISFTFSYPANWVKQYDKPIHTDVTQDSYSILLMHPGTVVHNEPIGSNSTFKGARVTIRGQKTTHKTLKAWVDSHPAYLKFNDLKNVKVAGVDAVEYTQAYESENTRYTALIKDGKIYTISFVAQDGPQSPKYLTDYRDLVKSFKF